MRPEGRNKTGSHKGRSAAQHVIGQRHKFELVKGISSNLFVYSALWAVTNVRLIAIMVQGHRFKNLRCVLYYSLNTTSSGVYVEPVVRELHSKRTPYTSASIKCPIHTEEHMEKIPVLVGLVERKMTSPAMLFSIENTDLERRMDTDRVDFTLCVPAMFRYKNAAQLVEKIEMSRLQGVGRIVLYNSSVYPNVDAVLRWYGQEWTEGRETLEVVVLPWHLPMENGEIISIRIYAQQLAIDDCLHRYKRLSRYMVFSDLDEFLLPLQHVTWLALLKDRRRRIPKAEGWAFRNSFVSRDSPSPAEGFEQDYQRYGSAILGLTMRETYVYPPFRRTKLIVDPTNIEEMGVHLIWEGAGITDTLPVDVGLLFHYRKPVTPCITHVKETRLASKYGKRLLSRLRTIWSKLPKVDLGWRLFKAGDKSMCNKSLQHNPRQ